MNSHDLLLSMCFSLCYDYLHAYISLQLNCQLLEEYSAILFILVCPNIPNAYT